MVRETAGMIQEMDRDYSHTTGDGQRLQPYYRRWSETADMIQEMDRDCRHDTQRWTETADMIQEMDRDCRHDTGDGQRLQQ
ncbi:unnamed protein product, partial [Staurois parvus]